MGVYTVAFREGRAKRRSCSHFSRVRPLEQCRANWELHLVSVLQMMRSACSAWETLYSGMWAARAPGYLPCLLCTLSFCHLILTWLWHRAVVENTRGSNRLPACERYQTLRRRGNRSQVGRVKFSPHSQVNAEAGQQLGARAAWVGGNRQFPGSGVRKAH